MHLIDDGRLMLVALRPFSAELFEPAAPRRPETVPGTLRSTTSPDVRRRDPDFAADAASRDVARPRLTAWTVAAMFSALRRNASV